jgi:HAD superfamily hydrolase (TIGR01509 family)
VGLRGVLLDSGDVLMGPRGGRWWPRPGFLETLAAERPGVDLSDFDAAHDPALAWYFGVRRGPMDAAQSLALERRYFRKILEGMDVEPTEDLLDALFRGDGLPLVEFAPDTRPLLEQLRARDLRLALVSDATPALRDFYVEAGLDHFFETMVISEELGCVKPDPRMYLTAADALGLQPHELIFLDNDVGNVRGAVAVGCDGVVLDVHGSAAEAEDLPVAGSLPDFLALLDERLAGASPPAA